MKPIIFTIAVFVFSIFTTSAQDILFFGGINSNRFCDYKKNSSNFNTIYTSLSGYNLGIGIDDVKIARVPFMFTCRLINYKGNIYTAIDGPEGEKATKAAIEKSAIGLGIYPVSVKILSNKINFNLGCEFNALTDATAKGYQSSRQMTAANTDYRTIDNNSKEIMNNFSFGLSSRLAYKIMIKKNIFIMPQYSFYVGLSDEFKNIEASTKSYRHLFEIGIVKRLTGKGHGNKD